MDSWRYLGVYILAAKNFKCSLSNNKKSFYKSFNAILSKVGHCASADVVINLCSAKCLPILIYGLDACPVSLTDKHTLDFIMNRTFMRIFKTGSIDIVNECILRFNLCKWSETVINRKRRFLLRFSLSDNAVCNFFTNAAQSELLLLSR